jgi:hypothetical protein
MYSVNAVHYSLTSALHTVTLALNKRIVCFKTCFTTPQTWVCSGMLLRTSDYQYINSDRDSRLQQKQFYFVMSPILEYFMHLLVDISKPKILHD